MKPMNQCGFCQSGSHKLCPRAIRQANPKRADKLWICFCWHENPGIHLEPGEETPENLYTPRPHS